MQYDALTYDAMTHNMPGMDFNAPMTADEFRAALAKLNCSVYASADVLGISLRQAQRYAAGGDAIPMRTAKHLRILLMHVHENQDRRRQLLAEISRREARGFTGVKDANLLADYRRQVRELETILVNHPTGISPGFGEDA